jgi:hypothetical protein
LKHVAVRRLLQKDLLTEEAANRGHRLGEGRLLFDVPEGLPDPQRVRLDVFGINQTDHTEQAQQTRGCPPHRRGHVLSGRLKAQVGRISWKAVSIGQRAVNQLTICLPGSKGSVV